MLQTEEEIPSSYIVFFLSRLQKGFFKRKKHGEEEEEEGLRKGDPDDDY